MNARKVHMYLAFLKQICYIAVTLYNKKIQKRTLYFLFKKGSYII